MKPIRFYHWWIYRLFWRVWNPLLAQRPDMVQFFKGWIEDWQAAQKR